jgi:hypothetical protein
MVPGGVMRDFLINFKTGDFYQKLKGLMQAIPGNSGTLYYQFHWMTTKKNLTIQIYMTGETTVGISFIG